MYSSIPSERFFLDRLLHETDRRVLEQLERIRKQHSHDEESLDRQAAHDLRAGKKMLVSIVSASRPSLHEVRPLDDPGHYPSKGDLIAFEGQPRVVRYAYLTPTPLDLPTIDLRERYSSVMAGCLID